MKGRILGVDYGKARIGIAYSDERQIIASPFCVCKQQGSLDHTLQNLKDKLACFSPFVRIVVGLPLLLNGTEGEMAKEARLCGEKLAALFEIPCIFWDERLSSKQAERLMKEGALSRKKRAMHSDTVCATLILQNYLDSI